VREKWIDIARGILIILVVFGHSAFIQYYSNWHSIIYWFHMPSFFFLSGYVFKPKENYGQQAKRITMRLLLPYAIILIAITCYRYMFTPMSPDVWRELLHISLGGRYIDGFYAPFWFITCLWFTQLVYAALIKLPKVYLWSILVIMFTVTHFLPVSWKIPGNLDLSLYAIMFFALGHQAKWIVSWYSSAVGTIVFFFSFYLAKQGYISFALDMKQHVLNGKFDLIIPLSGILMVVGISKCMKNIPLGEVLAPIGKESLMIMYLHLVATLELYRLGVYKDILMFVLIGISLPMIIHSTVLAIKPLAAIRINTNKRKILDRA
jgi:fucose 4-O-acetylase-like acetyltransferase